MKHHAAIAEYIDSLEFFDTHEHLAGFDWGFTNTDAPVSQAHPYKTLPHVLMNDLLMFISGAALYKGPSLAIQDWPHDKAWDYWRAIQPHLDEMRAATVYTTIRRGIQELYGFDVDEVTEKNFDECNQRIVSVYQAKGQPAWMLEVAKRARVTAMVQMAHLPYLIEYWPSLPDERRRREQALVRPSLILEPFFFSGFEPDRSNARRRTMELLDKFPTNHEEHLAFQHEAIARHKQAGGAAVKFICAYQRSLRFENVPDDEARRLYAKGPSKLDAVEMVLLQDNLVRHLIRSAKAFNLPVQIHTGYSTPTSRGHPENLFDLAREKDFRSVQFYFCHAGWPAHYELAIMARSYDNIHFGFCWIPGLAASVARRMLDEMFDLLPANKMLVGTDCGTVENFYGTALLTRELVAQVLAAKVENGMISLRAAKTVARRFFYDNAVNLFGRPEERALLAHAAV